MIVFNVFFKSKIGLITMRIQDLYLPLNIVWGEDQNQEAGFGTFSFPTRAVLRFTRSNFPFAIFQIKSNKKEPSHHSFSTYI